MACGCTTRTVTIVGFSIIALTNGILYSIGSLSSYTAPINSVLLLPGRGENITWTDINKVDNYFEHSHNSIVDGPIHTTVSLKKDIDSQINTLKQVRLPLLPNYRNPCWYERLPRTDSQMYLPGHQMFKDQAEAAYVKLRPLMTSRRAKRQDWRLRCLPLFYLIGVAKCGTTDLFSLLNEHPQFVRGATKEPMFWNVNRWSRGARLADFLDLYDFAAETIRTTTVTNQNHTTITGDDIGEEHLAYHPVITGDFSVSLLFKFTGAARFTRSRGEGPTVIPAHLIKVVTPGARVAVIVRNPTERLWSEYLFFNKHKHTSPQEFHTIASAAVRLMSSCLHNAGRSERSCAYDQRYTRTRKWVRLVAGMYYPFIRDWLEVFPDMMVIRTEDYHDNRAAVFKNLTEFIGLEPYIHPQLVSDHITNKGPTKKYRMLNETREMLDSFYRPLNRKLADLLKDDRFLY